MYSMPKINYLQLFKCQMFINNTKISNKQKKNGKCINQIKQYHHPFYVIYIYIYIKPWPCSNPQDYNIFSSTKYTGQTNLHLFPLKSLSWKV